MGGEGLAAIEHVDRDDDTDDDIVNALEEVIDIDRDVRGDVLQHGQQRARRPRNESVGEVPHRAADRLLELRIVREHAREPSVRRGDIVAAVDDHALDAADDLGRDEPDHAAHDDEQGDDGEKHREPAGELRNALCRLRAAAEDKLRKRREEVALINLHQRIEQIGDHQPPNKGTQDIAEALECGAEPVEVADKQIKQNARRDDEERRHTPI